MSMAAMNDLQQLTLGLGFVLALFFGWVSQTSSFCTMGAISDIVNMGDWSRMRMWALAVGVAILGFWVLAGLSLIDPERSVYTTRRLLWLSALSGGLLFGFGMVLASGCASKNLLRLGAGSLKALMVLLVMGASALATQRGFLMTWRNQSVDQVQIETDALSSLLPSALAQGAGLSLASAGLLMGLLAGTGLIAWALRDPVFRGDKVLILGGLGVGLAVVLMWWINGHLSLVAEHPLTLESIYLHGAGQSYEALSFVGPASRTVDWLAGNSPLTMGIVLIGGVIMGAALQATYSGRFHWEGLHGTRDTGLHLLGALFMGVGGITAGGCTLGQGVSGISTLSVVSLIAVAGIMAGGVLGLRFQTWLIMRE